MLVYVLTGSSIQGQVALFADPDDAISHISSTASTTTAQVLNQMLTTSTAGDLADHTNPITTKTVGKPEVGAQCSHFTVDNTGMSYTELKHNDILTFEFQVNVSHDPFHLGCIMNVQAVNFPGAMSLNLILLRERN